MNTAWDWIALSGQSQPFSKPTRYMVMMFSGGVSDCIYGMGRGYSLRPVENVQVFQHFAVDVFARSEWKGVLVVYGPVK